MNICFVNSTRKWGGVKSWTLDVAAGLVESGHRVLVIGRAGAFTDTARELDLEAMGITFGPDFNPILILKFLRIFSNRKIDLVVVNVGKDMRSAGLAAKLLGIPVIHRVGLAGDMENTFKVRAMHKWVRPSILVPCEQIKHGILRKLPYLAAEDITVIRTGKIPAPHPPALVNTPLRFISTSQLNADKGHKDVLLALKDLKHHGVRFEYHILGTGHIEAELRGLASSLDLDDRIIWRGFQKNVRAQLQHADIFLLPSYVEGLPNSLLEAMAEGLVCVARDVGGVNEAWPTEMRHLLLDPRSGPADWSRTLFHLAERTIPELIALRHIFWSMANTNAFSHMIRAFERFAFTRKRPTHAPTEL